MDWTGFLYGVLCYIIGQLTMYYQMKNGKSYPHGWRCDMCEFTVDSTSEYAVDRIRTDHKRISHG